MRTTTGVSLPAELKEAAERPAKREQRSLSSLIRVVLERYLREVGAWKDSKLDDAEERSVCLATEFPPPAQSQPAVTVLSLSSSGADPSVGLLPTV
jgi:predicted DNA-binding protein